MKSYSEVTSFKKDLYEGEVDLSYDNLIYSQEYWNNSVDLTEEEIEKYGDAGIPEVYQIYDTDLTVKEAFNLVCEYGNLMFVVVEDEKGNNKVLFCELSFGVPSILEKNNNFNVDCHINF